MQLILDFVTVVLGVNFWLLLRMYVETEKLRYGVGLTLTALALWAMIYGAAYSHKMFEGP